MKMKWKRLVAIMFSVLGSLAWCYIGGWLVLSRPIKGLVVAHMAGNLTIGRFIAAMAQAFGYLSLAGGVWCIGYMLSNYLKK